MTTPQTPAEASSAQSTDRDVSVLSQSLDLEIDFRNQSLRGTTKIQVVPISRALRQIRLNCRQCRITRISVDNEIATYSYRDPFTRLKPQCSYGVHQAHLFRGRLEPQFADPPQEELVIRVPNKIHLREANPFDSAAQDAFNRSSRRAGNASAGPDTPTVSTATEQNLTYAPVEVNIDFEIPQIREGLQFVGLAPGDSRYPHAYTHNSPFPGRACCLFPCFDDLQSRCSWDIRIQCARTLGEALAKSHPDRPSSLHWEQKKDSAREVEERSNLEADIEEIFGLTRPEAAIDMQVVCSGELTDEDDSASEPGKKAWSFSCSAPVSANQIGFAVGPFETVELSDLREIDEDDRLGTDAVRVYAHCLPGRVDEVKNTTMAISKAIDYFTTTFTTFPFSSYRLCFVDDLGSDKTVTAGLSLCSTRLLFPEDIIDPMYDNTRTLVHALASQYAGISFSAKDTTDSWCIVGMAYFMTDLFLKYLCGNNEYRYRQKLAAERVCELDYERPPLHSLGSILHLDPSEEEFLALKSGVVLFILDRRLTKSTGFTGVARVISRTITNAKAGDAESSLLSTGQFQRTCEKLGHMKLDTFFQQWIFGAGCPNFMVSQRFNKKKLVVEMQIIQVQGDPEKQVKQRSQNLNPNDFLRDINEDANEVYAGNMQNVFTGPMTIRIHEADGTPYEHVVEIQEANFKFEIPYNTKYKRLKRRGKQKDRPLNSSAADNAQVEANDEVLLYSLGDVLQSEEEMADWRLHDWPKEEEDKMSQESYEWIRMDADFEWICQMSINMPPYMFVSQLQQDRDVVAQLESLQWIGSQRPHWLVSTFLTRTVMDRRYFHGIRTAAAAILPKCATEDLDFVGFFHLERMFRELFCISNSSQTRQNDFSDRAAYLVQNAIPTAMSKIRNSAGRVPISVKRFFIDRLKFNDNSTNQYSDCYYVATLLSGLADILAAPRIQRSVDDIDLDAVEDEEFYRDAVSEIERYRRIDEWVSSYGNVYSITALQCLLRLAKAQVLQPKLADFLQYTRQGNADVLRLQAFYCLIEQGKFGHGPVVKYIMHTLSHDRSPYMRNNLWRILGKGLGLVAIGYDRPKIDTADFDGMIIEQEGSTETREAEFARKQTVDGAVAALKQEMASIEALKHGIWTALTSPVISLGEMSRLFDLCSVLYDEQDTVLVGLRYPRYWKVVHLGQGQLRFSQSQKVRTKKAPPRLGQIQPRAAPTAVQPTKIRFTKPAQPSLERRPSNPGVISLSHPKLPPAPPAPIRPKSASVTPGPPNRGEVASTAAAASQSSSKPSKIVKLRVGQRLLNAGFSSPTIKLESTVAPGVPSANPQSPATAFASQRPSSSGGSRIRLTSSRTQQSSEGTAVQSPSPAPSRSHMSPSASMPKGGEANGDGPRTRRRSSATSGRSLSSLTTPPMKSPSVGSRKRKSSASASADTSKAVTPQPASAHSEGMPLNPNPANGSQQQQDSQAAPPAKKLKINFSNLHREASFERQC